MSSERENLSQITVGEPTLASVSPNNRGTPTTISIPCNNQVYANGIRDGSRRVKTKKPRFHWDGELHLHFLQQIYKFGLDNISTQTVFNTMRQYSNDITYDFIDSQLKSYREHLEESLQEFAQYYNQSFQYQENYSDTDAVSGKFSVYPFAPQSASAINDEIPPVPSVQSNVPESTYSQSTVSMSQHQEASSSQEMSQFRQDSKPLVPILPSIPIQQQQYPDESHNRIAMPNWSHFMNRESAMDSQFQLHQDMMSQNNYILKRMENLDESIHGRTFGDAMRSTGPDLIGITSSEDDAGSMGTRHSRRKHTAKEQFPLDLINTVLSPQNDRFVEQVNRVLNENPFHAPDNSIQYSGLDVFNEESFNFPPYGDVFDFLS
ncbi:hypothetical protein WA171_000391 [Blastocystis sp. BT1]